MSVLALDGSDGIRFDCFCWSKVQKWIKSGRQGINAGDATPQVVTLCVRTLADLCEAVLINSYVVRYNWIRSHRLVSVHGLHRKITGFVAALQHAALQRPCVFRLCKKNWRKFRLHLHRHQYHHPIVGDSCSGAFPNPLAPALRN